MRPAHRDERNPACRIAVVGAAAALGGTLREMANTPTVREFDDLFLGAAALSEFAPSVLGFAHGPEFDQDLGAVRMLRALLPELAAVMVCDPGQLAPGCRSKCALNEVHLLDRNSSPLEVERVFTRALTDGSSTASYLQLVQGICDEINNPLLFASGHLQLLASRLDPSADSGALAQVAAVRHGLDRIRQTMHKVAIMGRATRIERRRGSFALGTLAESVEQQIRTAALAAAVRCGEGTRPVVLEGDLELVAGALFGLCEVGCELSQRGEPVALQLSGTEAGVDVRMRIHNSLLEQWELPRAFEPYRLNDVLRGTTLGLNLFLVRLVTRAHGWDAFARRLPDRAVEFCIGGTPAG